MISKQALKRELWQRIERCRDKGDWRGAEVYSAAWLRVNAEPDDLRQFSGLARRIAASQAATPLDARRSTTIPIQRVQRGTPDHPAIWHCDYCGTDGCGPCDCADARLVDHAPGEGGE